MLALLVLTRMLIYIIWVTNQSTMQIPLDCCKCFEFRLRSHTSKTAPSIHNAVDIKRVAAVCIWITDTLSTLPELYCSTNHRSTSTWQYISMTRGKEVAPKFELERKEVYNFLLHISVAFEGLFSIGIEKCIRPYWRIVHWLCAMKVIPINIISWLLLFAEEEQKYLHFGAWMKEWMLDPNPVLLRGCDRNCDDDERRHTEPTIEGGSVDGWE